MKYFAISIALFHCLMFFLIDINFGNDFYFPSIIFSIFFTFSCAGFFNLSKRFLTIYYLPVAGFLPSIILCYFFKACFWIGCYNIESIFTNSGLAHLFVKLILFFTSYLIITKALNFFSLEVTFKFLFPYLSAMLLFLMIFHEIKFILF